MLEMVRLGASPQPHYKPEVEAQSLGSRLLQFPYLLTATAMVAVVVVAMISNLTTMQVVDDSVDAHVEIVEFLHVQPSNVPLGGPALFEQIDPGYAGIIGGDIRNIKLALVDAERHLLGVASMEEGGIFRFDHLPDGSYRALALPPDYEIHFSGIEIGSLVVTQGRAQLVLSRGLENFWEGAEIQIWLMSG